MRDNGHLPAGHPLRGKRLAIVGGGPAGLTLARLLRRRDVAATVFEREGFAGARDQGGSLDLHEESGQRALAAAGLDAGFHGRARPEGQHGRVFDKHGVVRAEIRAGTGARAKPEIDRGDLRDLLLRSLEPTAVRWGRRLVEARRESGAPLLVFEDGVVEADLVFGCDGGWSKVRPLVSDTRQPSYSGATFVQATIADVDRRHPEIAAFVGPGSVMALGDRKGLAAQRNGNGSVRVYAMLSVPEGWVAASGVADPAQAHSVLLAAFENWSPAFTRLLAATDRDYRPWPLFLHPARQTWRPRADATLLGDAAHVMPPFTAKGANYAMLDALELSEALTNGEHPTIEAALAAFEEGMLDRMDKAITETMASQDLLLAHDAPDGLAALMARDPAPRSGDVPIAPTDVQGRETA